MANINSVLSAMPPIPDYAMMVIGEYWSGWWWGTSLSSFHLIYRFQGDTGANYRIFNRLADINQFIDGLEGDTDEFIRN